jgi:hypothetical protein
MSGMVGTGWRIWRGSEEEALPAARGRAYATHTVFAYTNSRMPRGESSRP